MEKSALLLLTLLLLGAWGNGADAKLHRYKWKAEYSFRSPDCVEAVIIAVNGQYPGPTIRARVGDTVVVELENALPTEGLAIHWHGIRQVGTPWADGTPFVSQCGINRGEIFRYKFLLDKAGTFLYHGHLGLQRAAGFYGSLIVDPAVGQSEPFSYDAELSILINDWWHRSIYNQETGLESIPFRFVGEPQSLLIEGRGAYNCSLVPSGAVAGSGDAVSCNSTSPQCGPHILQVEPGKTYRLRVASSASLSSLNLVLEGHKMTVVEADGSYVQPVVVDNLDVYSGQTYSVVFTADQDPSRNYWVGINVRGRNPKTPTGLGIINYLPNAATPPSSPPPQSPVWNDFAYSSAQAKKLVARQGFVQAPPVKADRKLVFLTTQNRVNGFLRWAINNVSYAHPATPVLAALKYKLKHSFDATPLLDVYPNLLAYNISAPPANPNATFGNGVYTFKLGDVVDVVIQNSNTLTPNNSEIHPWHLHGHDFWVLGYGDGVFDAAKDEASCNLHNPLRRNTVAVFPYGWAAIRFVADNPGVWPFHCHVEAHFYLGMGVVFAEGVSQLPSVPFQNLGCGETKRLFKH